MKVLVAIVLLMAGDFLGLTMATTGPATGLEKSVQLFISAFKERTGGAPPPNLNSIASFYGVEQETVIKSADVWAYFNSTVTSSPTRDHESQVAMLRAEFGNVYEIFINAHTGPVEMSKVTKFLSEWYLGQEALLRGQDVDRFCEAVLGLSKPFSQLHGDDEYKKLLRKVSDYRAKAGTSDCHGEPISFPEMMDRAIMEMRNVQLFKMEGLVRKIAVWFMFCYKPDDYDACRNKLLDACRGLRKLEGAGSGSFEKIKSSDANPFRQHE